jgi:hypothetical protein
MTTQSACCMTTQSELNPTLSATPPSPPLLPLQDPQDQHGPPQDLPPPRTVRRLALETVDMQQASDSLQQRLPSPKRAANLVGKEAPDPALPVVYCSQYRMEEYELQILPLPRNKAVAPSAAQHKHKYVSDSESENGLRRQRRRRPVEDDRRLLCSLRTLACAQGPQRQARASSVFLCHWTARRLPTRRLCVF